MYRPRAWYHKRKAKQNKNHSCSVLCNNCTGGVILHDLKLKFNTPTINTLFYSYDDFIFFVKNIRDIASKELIEVGDTDQHYPVGQINILNRNLMIGFVHYNNFAQARSKWIERFRRIDYDNLYVIIEGKDVSYKHLDDIASINLPKCVYSDFDKLKSKAFNFYNGHHLYDDWHPGKVFEYKHLFGLKRYLDDFDYISFLNH